METKGFFQFEIIINVFVSSMLWVKRHYKFMFNFFYASIVFSRPHAEKVKGIITGNKREKPHQEKFGSVSRSEKLKTICPIASKCDFDL